jgi:hypothetical protein
MAIIANALKPGNASGSNSDELTGLTAIYLILPVAMWRWS